MKFKHGFKHVSAVIKLLFTVPDRMRPEPMSTKLVPQIVSEKSSNDN